MTDTKCHKKKPAHKTHMEYMGTLSKTTLDSKYERLLGSKCSFAGPNAPSRFTLFKVPPHKRFSITAYDGGQ